MTDINLLLPSLGLQTGLEDGQTTVALLVFGLALQTGLEDRLKILSSPLFAAPFGSSHVSNYNYVYVYKYMYGGTNVRTHVAAHVAILNFAPRP